MLMSRVSNRNCRWLWAALACLAVLLLAGDRVAAAKKLNVLFIAIDDLRPQLGCYGQSEMVTPSLDKLASESRRFNHHYVQVPTCGASRCALLTGQYPASPIAYDNNAFKGLSRTPGEGPLSLPELFQQNGYRTVAIGKISHSPDGHNGDGSFELPYGWDKAGMPHGDWTDAWSAFFAYAGGKTRIVRQTPVSERVDVPDDAYPDGLIATAAIEELKQLKDAPFFLAVGFIKPHLPFNAPSRYWDLYDADKIPPAANPAPPKNIDPAISLHKSGEMRGQYTGFSQPGIVTEEEAKHLRHAYRACVSYVDTQVGRVLKALDELKLRDSTIVVVWGDHGWHLGEHGVWGKHTLQEVALRSPLMVRVPGMASPGAPADGLVETVDIYPTLAELCGLDAPRRLSGRSFVRLVKDPAGAGKPAVLGFWRGGRAHTIRTPEYRYTEWRSAADSPHVVQRELYDEKDDPNESVNVAEFHPQVVAELAKRLRSAAPMLKAPAQGAAAGQ